MSALFNSTRQCLRLTCNVTNFYKQLSRSHYTYSGPGRHTTTLEQLEQVWRQRDFDQRGFTVGIGGPVGSGKTALTLKLCQSTQPKIDAVVTNDIFTQEDADFLVINNALPKHRIKAVETGGCPHAAIREDVSANLQALEQLTRAIQKENINNNTAQPPPLLLCESGGDNLAANFSRELADLIIYVICVAGGEKVPRKGGPGITQSDLLVINKIDLADAVGANLTVMERDAHSMRHSHNHDHNDNSHNDTVVMASVKHGTSVDKIQDFITKAYNRAMEIHDEKKQNQTK